MNKIEIPSDIAGPAPRHLTTQVMVGNVAVGGGAPIVVQSMTNTDTADIQGTIDQVAALSRAGSEMVRITVDRDEAAAAVPHIREALADLRDRSSTLITIDGDAHQLRAGPVKGGNLCNGRIDIGRIGIGHRLHDDRRTAADHHAADIDANRLLARKNAHVASK